MEKKQKTRPETSKSRKSSNPKKDKGSKHREMQMTSDDSYDSWLVFKWFQNVIQRIWNTTLES